MSSESMECAYAGCGERVVKRIRVIDLENGDSEIMGLCVKHARNRVKIVNCRVVCAVPNLSKSKSREYRI